MKTILIGPGLFHLVDIDVIPNGASRVNLGSKALSPGVYEITPAGTRKWGEEIYPYFTYEYVGSLPQDAVCLAMALLNI